MHIITILSGLVAMTLALPFVPPDKSAQVDRGNIKPKSAVNKLAEGALIVGGIGGALYGAHKMGQKSAQREFHGEMESNRVSGYVKGYTLGRLEERLRFLSVVGLINECIDELVSPPPWNTHIPQVMGILALTP